MAIEVPVQLKEVAEQVNGGHERTETVRILLSWFGFERRGYNKVRQIRKTLNKLKLRTEPDFEGAWVDSPVAFLAKPSSNSSRPAAMAAEQAESETGEAADTARVPLKNGHDPTSRIGRLAAANRRPLCVAPDAEVAQAITLMLQNDYSQLPVMTTDRDVKGMFSWKSLGSRLALGRDCSKVRELMETAWEISADASLFEVIQQIVEHESVLVRDSSRLITGIVTTADLGVQLAQLGEPFLMLGQIENHVRGLIADKYTKKELADAKDPADSGRKIDDVADLTLGECARLLESKARWPKLAIRLDRKVFVDELQRVVRIRNDVMHFDPDGVGPEDLKMLRQFAKFLGDLQKKLN